MSAAGMLPLDRECGACQNGDHHHCCSLMGVPCPCEEVLLDGSPCSQLLPESAEYHIPSDDEGLFDPAAFEDVLREEQTQLEDKLMDDPKMWGLVSSSDSSLTSIPFVGGIQPPKRKASLATLNEIADNKLLIGVTNETYRTLWHIGPATAGEVTKAFRPGCHKRLPELERMGCIRRIGRRICEVSGKQADLWDVTDELPKPQQKSLARTHVLMSTGPTVDICIRNFTDPVGWKIKLLLEESNPKYHWSRRVLTDSNESFEAAGQRVPGGYVMTLWR